jgi:peptidoglycan/LPS O-acetylase OafA/YrhL
MFKINGVLWTIAIEVQIYLLFPAFAKAIQRFGRFPALVLASIVPAVVAGLSSQWPKHYAWFLPLFVLGMVAASLVYRPIGGRSPSASMGWAAGIIGLAGWIGLLQFPAPLWSRDAAGAFVIVGLGIVICLVPDGRVTRIFGSRIFAGLGAFSYSLYLMHHPIQQVGFWLLGGPDLAPTGKLFALILWSPVMIAGSWVFYRFFEYPVLSRRSESGQKLKTDFPLSLPLQVAEVGCEEN